MAHPLRSLCMCCALQASVDRDARTLMVICHPLDGLGGDALGTGGLHLGAVQSTIGCPQHQGARGLEAAGRGRMRVGDTLAPHMI